MPVARKRKKTSNHHHSRTKRKLFKDVDALNEGMVVDAIERAKEAKKPDRERGLYPKWQARRIDGSSDKGKKHAACKLFILDLDHDPHATPAIFSYATSAQADGYEQLAGNLFALIQPYIKQLEERARLEETGEYTDAERAAVASLSDAELLHKINMGAWVETDGIAHLELEQLMDRFKKLTAKPKRTRKKVVKDAAATDKSA